MTITEFEGYLLDHDIVLSGQTNGIYNGIVSSEISLLKPYWEKVKAAIEPHYFGESMPHSIIEAFPNEDERQHKFRTRIYESPTNSYLWRAIQDVNRIVMNPNFIAEFGDNLAAYLKENPNAFNGYALDEYISSELYNLRVLDPNGYIVILPTNVAELRENEDGSLSSDPAQLDKKMGIKVQYYPSENLILQDDDMLIFLEYISTGMALVGQFGYKLCYRIVTNNSSFLYDPSAINKADIYKEYLFQPNRNWLPAQVLGGQVITQKEPTTQILLSYNKSDFSYAVPAMNELAVSANQLKVVTVTSTYPHMIIRTQPCTAKDCDRGIVIEYDGDGNAVYSEDGRLKSHECKTCKGKGVLTFSTMGAMVVPKGNSALSGDKEIPLNDMVHYVAPPVEIVKELREQKTAAQSEVEQTLSIVRQKMVGQTADSKEMDNDQKQTFLSNIALGMARLKRAILVSSIFYVLDEAFWADEVARINISTPKSFNILSTEALRLQRDANRKDKSLAVRAAESLQLIEKETDNPILIRAAELLLKYTENRSEATIEELTRLQGSGIINDQQYYEALFAEQVIKSLLYANPDLDNAALLAQIKQEFAYLAKNTDIAAQLAALPRGN